MSTSATNDAMSAIRDAALRYAECDWPVFPLRPIIDGRCECGALDCAGKHPAAGGWQRTIPSVVAVPGLWADRHGMRGIGLACGPRAGLWGLDIDPRHDGDRTLRGLQERHGPLPRTLTSRTGSGGWHLIFKWPADGGEIPTRTDVAPGLDVRGAGGYLVLPPSPHVNGQNYAWIVAPTEQERAHAPEWLLALVRQDTRRITRASGEEAPLVPRGQRHEMLIRFCGTLRAMGLREETIVECGHSFLRHQVEADPEKPIDLEHAEQSMRSVARRYPPRPNRRSDVPRD